MKVKEFFDELKFIEINFYDKNIEGRMTTDFNDLDSGESPTRYLFEIHYLNNLPEKKSFKSFNDIDKILFDYKILKIKVSTYSMKLNWTPKDYSIFTFIVSE